jgi:hypothetical protein
VIDLYTNQSSHIQQSNVQHNKKFFTPARRSPCRPWTSSRITVEVARKKASYPALAVKTGSEGTTQVPLPPQQTTRAKRIPDPSGALPKKKHLTNSSYI